MEQLPAQRPGSIRSVASNSSIASGVSLSRRPRTRARSKTVTGSSSCPDGPPQSPSAPSDLPYLNGTIVQEPLEQVPSVPPISLSVRPERPPRSPQRLETLDTRSSDAGSSQLGTAVDDTIVEPLSAAPNFARPAKATKVAASLAHLDTGYRPPPSAFGRDPALTPVVNVRDSVSTQQSGASSSLYPPSTSTASAPESPTSPLSMSEHLESIHTVSFSPEVNEVQEYDSDDVSYRLRLLVKNNYFLPPAHSKPSPADFASSSLNPSKAPSKPNTPTFLDIFRIGKAKSKPTTPTGGISGFDLSTGPMLRTTSDSITPPYASNKPQARVSAQMQRPSPHLPNAASRGRVVVVREKMHDIAVAAKKAEQDLKMRGVRIDHGSQKGKLDVVDDIIDPTDAVDIPLPSASYPFAVQTSAMHGLGVLESVGADVLADHLPPNISATYDPIEDSWRKALLHEAVHHSLDNTPDVSTFSHILGASTPVGSPLSKSMDTPRRDAPLTQRELLQKRIVARPMIDVTESTPTKHKRQRSARSLGSHSTKDAKSKPTTLTVNTSHDSSRPPSYLPQRVETPSGPMTPLGLPPRRAMASPPFSLSPTDPTSNDPPYSPISVSDEGRPTLRRTISSPQLAEGYESSTSRHAMFIPDMPPYPRDSQITVTTVDTARGSFKTVNGSGMPSEQHESDGEDNHSTRNSLSLSAMNGRPSMSVSEYSQASMSPMTLSPTTSTFQDMLNHDHEESYSSPGPSRFSMEQQGAMRGTPSLRYSAMSPPPRMSSSLAHTALPPPPRTSSLGYPGRVVEHIPWALSSSTSESSHTPAQSPAPDATFQINAPEPTTPPYPERRSQSSRSPLSLTISNAHVPVAIHSAPGPSSPTSFFDSIQNQPNAMDDLESSSGESDDEQPTMTSHPKPYVDPRHRAVSNAASHSRPAIMKHGNFSAPYLRPGETYPQNLVPIGNNVHSMKPVANVPLRPSKNDTLPSSSYDFFKYAQDNPPAPHSASTAESNDSRRPSADHVTTWRNNQKAQESLRKLDGMLLQHMEDEKDTIKRIATTLKVKQTAPP